MNSEQFDRLEFGYYTGKIKRRDFIKRSLALGVAATTVMSVASCGEKANEVQANQRELKTNYDYIVVGAGSAGCVLAANLAEKSGKTVLLVESGDWYAEEEERDPDSVFVNLGGNKSNNYFFESPAIGNRQMLLATGRGIGGGSRINGSLWVRGYKQDYDDWESATGSSKWGWANALQKYKYIENFDGETNEYHGYEGKLYVKQLNNQTELVEDVLSSAETAGFQKYSDVNGEMLLGSEGCGTTQGLIKENQRFSMLHSYLYPQLENRNLTIVTGKFVSKVFVESGGVCTGIQIVEGESTKTVYANEETILSAGAIESPAILQRSGIGNSELLSKMGINPVNVLSGVGENLRDHVSAGYLFLSPQVNSVPEHRLSAYIMTKSREGLTTPDMQTFLWGPSTEESLKTLLPEVNLPAENLFFLLSTLNKPVSKGSVKISSTDPTSKPIVSPNYLNEVSDIQALISAGKALHSMLSSMFAGGYTPLAPFPDSDAEIEALVRSSASSLYHYCGTCAMGKAGEAVVDPELKVNGISKLRVVDASVMPTIPRCNTMAPCVLIGEMATEFILKKSEIS